jgi:hypothetical protein
MDTGFRAAGNHDVRIAKGDKARGVADRVGACRASCGDSVVGALEGSEYGSRIRENWEGSTVKPYFMEMCPAARLMRRRGTNRGETFFAPWEKCKRGAGGRKRGGRVYMFCEC